MLISSRHRQLEPFFIAWSLLGVLGLVIEAAFMAWLVFPWLPVRHQKKYITLWSRRVLRRFKVSVREMNTCNLPAGGGYCIVANHISWIDIQVIHALVPCKFVTTTEIRSWPVIGKMVEASGALFIDLGSVRQSTRQITRQMVDMLGRHETLGFFPEATSSAGDGMLPFKANLFQAAVASNTPVYPLCIQYKDAQGQLSTAAGFHGDMSLLDCMKHILQASPLTAEITFLPPLTNFANRKELSQQCEAQIAAAFVQSRVF